MPVKPIAFGDEGQSAKRELVRRFEQVCATRPELAGGPLDGHLRNLEAIDRQYGGSRALQLEGIEELVGAALAELARAQSALGRGAGAEARRDVADLTIGVALWAVRHGVPIVPVEPVANALAVCSNLAASRQELAAAFGLMQGVIAHVAPRLAPDLERSDPQRPWRILHVNYAITAVRTEDPALMNAAFDALDVALPDERAGFYSEALALSLGPRIAPQVRSCIEARHRKWNTL